MGQSESGALKRTPLYEAHREAKARFVPFAGYEMPVTYDGLIAEHTRVRNDVGLFDVSHMGEVIVRGPNAVAALDRLVTNDLTRLTDGRAIYTVMCNERGGAIDDLIIYRIREDELFVVVNASRRDVDFAWIREHLPDGVEATDEGDDWAQIALQGPKAADTLTAWSDREDFAAMRPFRLIDATVHGHRIRVATTGYTGAGGFEIYAPNASAKAVWDGLVVAGAPHGIGPAGLGARDTLRLEMGYCLYGQELDEDTSPLEAGLGWVVKLDRGEFIGRDALRAQKEAGLSRGLVAFEVLDRPIARTGYPIYAVGGADAVGVVSSGTRSPSLEKNIGLGFVPPSLQEVGSEFEIAVRKSRAMARVVGLPFYR